MHVCVHYRPQPHVSESRHIVVYTSGSSNMRHAYSYCLAHEHRQVTQALWDLIVSMWGGHTWEAKLNWAQAIEAYTPAAAAEKPWKADARQVNASILGCVDVHLNLKRALIWVSAWGCHNMCALFSWQDLYMHLCVYRPSSANACIDVGIICAYSHIRVVSSICMWQGTPIRGILDVRYMCTHEWDMSVMAPKQISSLRSQCTRV